MPIMEPPSALSFLSVVALISLVVPWGCEACDFPEFLQSRRDGPTREWHVQNLEYYRGREHRYTYAVTFLANRMKAQIHKSSSEHLQEPQSYDRQCVLEIEPGQFLVTHNEEGSSVQQYLCIEFIRRSDHVVQVRQSELSIKQDPRLCSDNGMSLSHWPLINKADLYDTYEPCPIVGGFYTRFYDKLERKGFCDVYAGETMVESECMKQEGMHFRFRYDKCIPDGLHMRTDQHVYCMADWEDEDQRFVILRDVSSDRQWCMRYPTVSNDNFIAVLFKDLVCEPVSSTSAGATEVPNEYLSVTMQRATAMATEPLCRDDYEGCEYWTEPCRTLGSETYMTCAKLCNICNSTLPRSCTLPRNLWGNWLESNAKGNDIIDVKDTSLSKYQYGNFRCINWDETVQPVTAEHLEQMFVTTFDNGCKPRYTCAEFKMHSPSVLHYKLSQSKVLPFYKADWNSIDCSSFHYKDDPMPAGDLHHSRHLKVLISMDSITNVDCGLEESVEFTITVDNGVLCHGMLTVKDSTLYKNKRLQLLFYDCPDREPLQEFTCLDSHRHGYIRKQTIITESADNTNDYQCWFFPVSPPNTFYRLPMTHCNEGAATKVMEGLITPLATFNMKYTTTTTTTTPQPTPRIVVEKIVGLGDTVNPTGKDHKTYPKEENDVNNPDDYAMPSASKKHANSYSHLSSGEDHRGPKDERLVSRDSDNNQRNNNNNNLQSVNSLDGSNNPRPANSGATRQADFLTRVEKVLLLLAFPLLL